MSVFLREGVYGLRQRVGLKNKGLLFEYFGIGIFNFFKGKCLSRPNTVVLNHFGDGMDRLDVKFGINFRIIDLVCVHSFFKGEIGMNGHIQEAKFYYNGKSYLWKMLVFLE